MNQATLEALVFTLLAKDGGGGGEVVNQIAKIETTESSEDGGENTVKITLTNGTSKTFVVKNGSTGGPGVQGVQGIQGEKGVPGIVGYWDSLTQAEKDAYTASMAAEGVDARLSMLEAGKADKSRAGYTQKRLENLESLLADRVQDLVDSGVDYEKTVPAGVLRYAAPTMIGAGEPVPWSQLIDGVEFHPGEVGAAGLTKGTKLISGHKYLFTAKAENVTNFTFVLSGYASKAVEIAKIGLDANLNLVTNVFFPATAAQAEYTAIGPSGSQYAAGNLYIYRWHDGGDQTTVTNAMLIDLTHVFGAGHEPETMEEFRAAFPLDYYPYAGYTPLPAAVSSVESQGVNLWDEQTRAGFYDDLGQWNPRSTVMSSANPIFVTGGTTLGLSNDVQIQITEWKKDGSFIKRTPVTQKDHTFTLREETAYIHINFPTDYVYAGGFSVNANATDIEYHRYAKAELVIPTAVKNLPGYGWSTGSICNSIEQDASGRWYFVKRVEKAAFNVSDLASESSDYYGTFDYTGSWFGERGLWVRNFAYYTKASVFTKRVKPEGFSATWRYGKIAINATKHTTAQARTLFAGFSSQEELRSALATDQDIYYEIETPVRTDITHLMQDVDMIPVEPGGTIAFTYEAIASEEIPVPNTITYQALKGS